MYAKLNPGLRYIQGMNELLAPLYFLFSTDPDRTSARYAEADAFYCFVDLISEFRWGTALQDAPHDVYRGGEGADGPCRTHRGMCMWDGGGYMMSMCWVQLLQWIFIWSVSLTVWVGARWLLHGIQL